MLITTLLHWILYNWGNFLSKKVPPTRPKSPKLTRRKSHGEATTPEGDNCNGVCGRFHCHSLGTNMEATNKLQNSSKNMKRKEGLKSKPLAGVGMWGVLLHALGSLPLTSHLTKMTSYYRSELMFLFIDWLWLLRTLDTDGAMFDAVNSVSYLYTCVSTSQLLGTEWILFDFVMWKPWILCKTFLDHGVCNRQTPSTTVLIF